MYTPALNRVSDQGELSAFMQRHPFATLVAEASNTLEAAHIPVLLDAQQGPQGTLQFHMARANPLWRAFQGQEILVIFHGPHAYISPEWYDEALSVPTWNYQAVHAYGIPQEVTVPEAQHSLMSRLVHAFEDGRANPWPYELPAAYVEKLFKAIVFFELPISRLEGKYKVSQNRSALEQQRVADRLSTSASLEDVAMGLEMKRLQGRG